MSDDPARDKAVERYEAARSRLWRAPTGSPAFARASIERREAENHLAYLLGRSRVIHHHLGHAYWVEAGELRRTETRHFRSKES
jgi:hypothetical protein